MINENLINSVLGIELTDKSSFNQLGLSNTSLPNSLSFFDDEKYLSQLNDNKNITGVFTEEKFKDLISSDKSKIIVDDARWSYFTLYNYLAKKNRKQFNTIVDTSSTIHKNSFVAEKNVIIGKNCIIYPNVTILEDVEIGDNCIIQSGTVIGSEGFEYKRTSKGIIGVYHDGKIIIGNNVDIGSNTSIDKGFLFKNTVIQDEVKIDNLVHIAHCVTIKKGAFIIASSMLAGSCVVGENAWVGPNATIGHVELGADSNVTFGSVVTKNVEEGQKVSGNFAIPHDKFLKFIKSI